MIHFRGWTYRCCCNTGDDVDVHADLAMESIWQQMKESVSRLEEISDGEEEEDNNDETVDNTPSSTATTTSSLSSLSSSSSWEPHFHRLHFPINLPLSFYNSWSGHDVINNTNNTLTSTLQIYGPNTTHIPLPPFLSLLTQQLLQPMFLFQLFCVLLWCMDEYWMYAIFTLGTLVIKKQQSQGHRRNAAAVRNVHDHERGSTIPADLLLLNGRAVVNEAMLTGESVPQVKESIEIGDSSEGGGVSNGSGGGGGKESSSPAVLDLSDGSAHKRCVLFGGTVLMDHHSSSEQDDYSDSSDTQSSPTTSIPSPPNQGLTCFVLRTGFDTIQGQLLRTLAYHAESGGGGSSGGGEGVNSKETFYFLLLLLLCALASAGTVVQHAWGDVTRNHFKLILHVVIIITSVIPPELPMELSLAVTTSLGELIKRYHVYCTEPFRIPLAGLVDTCCFDKTGTLTSDELRLHGVRLPGAGVGDENENENATGAKKNDGTSSGKEDEDLILFDDILSKSKSSTDDDDMGSVSSTIRSLLPPETLRVMVGCQSLAITHVFVPGRDGRSVVQTELCGDPLEKAVMEGCGYTIHPRTDTVVEKTSLVGDGSGAPNNMNGVSSSIKVLHRFAFSSKLRRMTVLALDTATGDDDNTLWALTKGAPEALKPMLDPKSLPDDYEQSYLHHMTLGRRVLALGYRNLGKSPVNNNLVVKKWKSSRDNVEQKLIFAGLLIMDSPLKADSARVVKELRGGNQSVVMVTGDAVLTAAEVARRVGIIDASQECTYDLVCREDDDVNNSASGKEQRQKFVFRPLDHNTGANNASNEADKDIPYTPSNLPKLEALVREGKANFCVTGDVLTKLAIHAVELATIGRNSFAIDDHTVLNHPAAKSTLSQLAPIISVFARHAPRHKEAVIAAFNACGRHTLMCGDGTNDVGALKQAHVGVSIISVPDLEAKQRSANDVISAVKAEEKKERKKAKKTSKSGKSKTKPKRSRADRVERSLQALAEAEDELNFVSLGNASVASPFTSRKTSVRCCKDILQQGRCTLVTMITIYKILGVQCLVNALVLTKLHQKGVKQGDRQLTAVGLVVAVLFLFVTRGKPLPRLSTKKPPSSVLCKGTLLSMTVQFGIHFAAIMAVTFMSDAYVDPYDPSIVPDGPFHPNTLNTATFLVTVLSSINAFLVNYRGRPYMEDMTENKLFFRSIQGCYFVLFVCAVEIFPPLNQLMQLSPLPSSGPPLFGLQEGSVVYEDSIVHDLLLQAVSSVGFRTLLCVIMCLDTALVTVAEKTIRSVLDA
ncbi:hypothetical protein ACHAXR_007376 [Thalassiosira sp. AJA248-18]